LPDDADIVSAFALMKKYHIRRFPVINKNGELVGIATQKDILEGMAHIIQHLDWKLVRTKIAFSDFQKHLADVEVI
jgi:CBS-domain-containing membrane protein